MQKFPKLFCCCSVTKSYQTLCEPMDYRTPSFPVLHYLLEFVQTHVHWVSDAIQPSHPLSSPSPPALRLSQHQGLFQWVSPLHQEAKVLELQHQSILPMNIQGWFPLGLTGLISSQSRGLSRAFSNTTNWRNQVLKSYLKALKWNTFYKANNYFINYVTFESRFLNTFLFFLKWNNPS